MTLASRYNTRVTVQSPTVSINAVGEEVETWATVVTRWGDLRAISGSEIEIQGVASRTRWQLRVRYENALSSMTPKWRVTTASQTFDIDAIINVDNRSRELLLNLIEIV